MKNLSYLFLVFCLSTYVHADLAYVCNSASESVSVIDTDTNTVIDVIGGVSGDPFTQPSDIAITPNNQLALVVNSNGAANSVTVFETATNTVMQNVPTTPAPPDGIAITPNGQSAYVCRLDFPSLVDLISIPSFAVTPITVSGGGTVTVDVAITLDGHFAYITNEVENVVYVLDTSTNMLANTINAGAGAGPIVISPNGFAYVGNEIAGTITAIDVSTLVPTTILLPNASTGFIIALGVRPITNEIYVTYQETTGNRVINTITGTTPGTPHLLSPPDTIGGGIGFTVDGSKLYLTSLNGNSVLAIDPDTFDLLATIPVGDSPSGIALIPGVPPSGPVNLQGKQLKNDAGLEYELFNQLQWQASAAPNVSGVSGYHIFRNGVLIATVGPDTLTYRDHNRKKGVEYQYAVAAFNAFGDSVPQTITLP